MTETTCATPTTPNFISPPNSVKRPRKVTFSEHYADEEMFLNVNTVDKYKDIENPQEIEAPKIETAIETSINSESSFHEPYFKQPTKMSKEIHRPSVAIKTARNEVKNIRGVKTP